MIDDSSNRLVWVAVGIALIFGIFVAVNAVFPGIATSVTTKISTLITSVKTN